MYQYNFSFEIHHDAEFDLTDCFLRKRRSRKRNIHSIAYPSQGQMILELDDSDPSLDDNWDDDSIEIIRRYLLRKSLALLADGRVSEAKREETLNWLMDDSVGPFTFLTCCYAEGTEPDAVRNLTLFVINRGA